MLVIHKHTETSYEKVYACFNKNSILRKNEELTWVAKYCPRNNFSDIQHISLRTLKFWEIRGYKVWYPFLILSFHAHLIKLTISLLPLFTEINSPKIGVYRMPSPNQNYYFSYNDLIPDMKGQDMWNSN